jgi:hypothetical protein
MTSAPAAERDRGRERLLLSNSALALVLAALVAVTLHEGAHALAGLLAGLIPTISTDQVEFTPKPGHTPSILIAAAGPVFSLVLGVVVHAATRSSGRGFGRLFWLWLGLISMQNFFGYLMIAPFAREGDSGLVFALLGAPAVVYVVAFAVGAALMLLNARLLASQVVRYAASIPELRRTVLLPWLVGTAAVVALTLLEAVRAGTGRGAFAIIAAGAVSIAVFAPLLTLFYRRRNRPYERLELRRPVAPLVITVVVAVLMVGFLAPGIRLG